MRRATRRWGMGIVLALLLPTSGCATFRTETTGPATWPPASPAIKQSVRLVLTHAASVNGIPKSPDTLSVWSARAFDAYRQSKLFSGVTDGGDSDLVADIHIHYASQTSTAGTIAWGLTLTLFPMQVREEVRVQTTLKDRSGKVIASIEKQEQTTTWFQLFLVFAMPAKAPGRMLGETLFDLHRATLADVSQVIG